MTTGDPRGERLPRPDELGDFQLAVPQLEAAPGADAIGAGVGPDRADGLPPLPPGFQYEVITRERHTARNLLRGAMALGAAAIVGLGGLYLYNQFGTRTTTTITIEEAQGVLDNISLVDRQQFAEAHGDMTASIDSSTQTRILHIPFTGINWDTPKYLTEHAGGSEAGDVDAVLERANAVTLSVGGTSEDNYYVKAIVDVTGLGIQGVNDFWSADGSEQDGFTTQQLNAFGISSDREARLNADEAIALNNLEASGENVLGDPKVDAAGLAGLIRNNILNPSAQLLEKIGPQGAALLSKMVGRPLYIEFVTYPQEAKPVNADKPLVDSSPNLISGLTPIASSQNQVTIQPPVGPASIFNFSVRTVSPKDTLLTINASKQYASILNAVKQSGSWFVVAVPPKAKQKATAGASSSTG